MGAIRETLTVDVGGAVSSLNQAGGAFRDAGQQADHAKDAFGAAGSGVAKLGGAASLVSPAFGQLVMTFADLADVGEVGAAVMGSLGLSVGSLVAVLAPVALIVGGMAYAWSEYQAEAEAATAAQESLNAALQDVRGIADAGRAEIDKLRVGLGQWSKAQYDDAQINATWDARLEAGTEALRAHRDELLAGAATLDSTHSARVAQAQALNEVNGLIQTAMTLNEQGRVAALANAVIARETAESDKTLADRARQKAAADRDAAAAASERKAAERELAASLAAEQAFVDGVQSAIDGLGDLFDTRQRDIEASNAAIDDMILAINGVGEAADQSAEKVAQMRAETSAARTGQVNAVGGALSSVASGNAIGLLAAAGPEGAAVAAVLSGLSAIGEQGAEAIAAKMTAQIEGIVGGITALPDLVEMLPGILIETFPDLVAALIQAGPELAMASLQAQFEVAKYIVTELPEAIGEAIGARLAELWEQVRDFLDHPIDSLRGDNTNTGWQKLQNTVVDVGRVLAGIATLGASEVAIGIVNGATDGGARRGLYSGSRETKSRTADMSERASMGPRRVNTPAEEQLGSLLMPALNRGDRRNNLTADTTARYGIAGPTRS